MTVNRLGRRASGKKAPPQASRSATPRLPRWAPAALAQGSEAHYRDAGYYSATYADRDEDIAYYVQVATEWAARKRCEVLEYGCGNGRILLPLVRSLSAIRSAQRPTPSRESQKPSVFCTNVGSRTSTPVVGSAGWSRWFAAMGRRWPPSSGVRW